jgi:hypothetical protein
MEIGIIPFPHIAKYREFDGKKKPLPGYGIMG